MAEPRCRKFNETRLIEGVLILLAVAGILAYFLLLTPVPQTMFPEKPIVVNPRPFSWINLTIYVAIIAIVMIVLFKKSFFRFAEENERRIIDFLQEANGKYRIYSLIKKLKIKDPYFKDLSFRQGDRIVKSMILGKLAEYGPDRRIILTKIAMGLIGTER